MMDKMSSITFPDGSQYEVVDDSARKDIVEINNNANNMQGAIDEVTRTLGYTKSYNLLPCNKTTSTWNGMTYTPVLDDEGLLAYYSLSGSRTSETYYNIYDSKNISTVFPKGVEVGKTYKVSANSTNALIKIAIYEMINGAYELSVNTNTEAEWTPNANTTRLEIRISVDSSASGLDDVRIYPMIKDASIEDDTYMPYVEDVQKQINNIGQIVAIEYLTATVTAGAEATIKSYTGLDVGVYIATFTVVGGANGWVGANIIQNNITLDGSRTFSNSSGASSQTNVSSIFRINSKTDVIKFVIQSQIALSAKSGQSIKIMRIA